MKTLIINGHPDPKSFTSQLSQKLHTKYHDSKLLNISELDFNPKYKGYSEKTLEEDIIEAQKLIKWADHIIIASPIWWSTLPGLLKSFIDKVLAPGFAFQYLSATKIDQKLKGKTADLYLLSDAPTWYRKYIQGDPAAKVLRRDILGFCGVKVKKIHRIGSMNQKNQNDRIRILKNI